MLGEALNEVFLPLFRQQFPEVVDFWLPPEGCSYRVAVVTIRKAYPGHAKRVMLGVWSYLRQFMYTKFVIVTDDDIDARDWKDVIWAISTRVDPARDLTILENTPIDYLDFASPESGLGSKLGIDATNKWPPETKREWGRKIRMSDDIIDQVTARWADYGLPGSGKPIWLAQAICERAPIFILGKSWPLEPPTYRPVISGEGARAYYRLGYCHAALDLARQLAQGKGQLLSAMPVLFLFRHYLELAMKDIFEAAGAFNIQQSDGLFGHDLEMLSELREGGRQLRPFSRRGIG